MRAYADTFTGWCEKRKLDIDVFFDVRWLRPGMPAARRWMDRKSKALTATSLSITSFELSTHSSSDSESLCGGVRISMYVAPVVEAYISMEAWHLYVAFLDKISTAFSLTGRDKMQNDK